MWFHHLSNHDKPGGVFSVGGIVCLYDIVAYHIVLYSILGSISHYIPSISLLNPIRPPFSLVRWLPYHYIQWYYLKLMNSTILVRSPFFVAQDALTALLAGEADAMWVYADQAKNYQCAEGATDTRRFRPTGCHGKWSYLVGKSM